MTETVIADLGGNNEIYRYRTFDNLVYWRFRNDGNLYFVGQG